MKGKSDPLAMEDHEYPDWLWRILENKKAAEESGTDGDIYCVFMAPGDLSGISSKFPQKSHLIT